MFQKPNQALRRDPCAFRPAASRPAYRRVRLASPPDHGEGVFASLLDSALRAFVEDAVLSVLEVNSVEPEPDGLCLRLVLQPRREGVYFATSEALVRLHAAKPRLRAALAAAMGVDVAPELLFEVRSWRHAGS
ncbi:MAG: hypothetical protein IT438_11220 [Phycisphaerales bacterium]|nr:hypothetical protein [Phycisphaerales bacterium]